MINEYILEFDDLIIELEKQEKWKTLAVLVYQQWKSYPMNLNRLLCAGTELWFILWVMEFCEYDTDLPPDFEYADEDWLQQMLMDVTRWGFQVFKDNATFNAYFGYLLKVKPYYFPDFNGDYDGWQNKGISMMRYAYQLEPTNPLAKAMHDETYGCTAGTPFWESCRELWNMVTPQQWGDSGVLYYFYSILKGDVFNDKT